MEKCYYCEHSLEYNLGIVDEYDTLINTRL